MDNNVDNNINEENDNTENNQNEEVLDQEVKEENTNVENNQNVQTMNQEVKEEIVNDLTKKKSDPMKVAIIISTIIVVITIGFIGFFWIMWPEIQNSMNTQWDKPVLYLYPEKDMDVKITFENEKALKTTYPKYNKEWNVHVKSDGSITDNDGRGYYALYWDENNNLKEDFKTGFYVKSDDSIKFLEEKLNEIGLTEREANEFIMYWLPKMEENGDNLVHFEFTKDREKENKLNIEPRPDSMLRMEIVIKKKKKKVNVKEQKIEHFDRVGFSVVEWGGTIIK